MPNIEDHPHACGDKKVIGLNGLLIVGSSPRVWGQVILRFLFLILIRIIPTRVGTSAEGVSVSLVLEDHPHACGDKCRTTFKYRRF